MSARTLYKYKTLLSVESVMNCSHESHQKVDVGLGNWPYWISSFLLAVVQGVTENQNTDYCQLSCCSISIFVINHPLHPFQ